MLIQHTIATPGADRRFFSAMAFVAALVVFAGFAPTYFLKQVFGTPPLSPMFHLHGALFTSWIVLFIVQTSLIATKRVRIHQRLGILGGFLAGAMLIVGYLAAITATRRAVNAGAAEALGFLVIPIGDLLQFGILIALGLYFRRRPQIHKRLFLLATIALLTPAIARLPHVLTYGPLLFFGLTDLFIAICFVYDRVVRGRIHPAFFWGGISMVAFQILRILIGGTSAWLAFAGWLIK